MFSTVEIAAAAHCVPDTGLQERVRLLCLAASQFQPHRLCSGKPPELKPVETLQEGRRQPKNSRRNRKAMCPFGSFVFVAALLIGQQWIFSLCKAVSLTFPLILSCTQHIFSDKCVWDGDRTLSVLELHQSEPSSGFAVQTHNKRCTIRQKCGKNTIIPFSVIFSLQHGGPVSAPAAGSDHQRLHHRAAA